MPIYWQDRHIIEEITMEKPIMKSKRRVWEIQSQCTHDGVEIWSKKQVKIFIKKLEEDALDDGCGAVMIKIRIHRRI